jgi:hypothetical protein
MSVANLNPASNALINQAEAFSCQITAIGASQVILSVSDGDTTYQIWTLTGGFQAGFSGTVTTLSGVTTLTTVAKSSGWWQSPMIITVEETIGGVVTEYTWNYRIAGIEIYPEGVRPYNEEYDVARFVQHDLEDHNDVAIINPQNDEVLTYQDGDWVNAPIPGGGPGGTAVEVVDESTSLTTAVSMITFAGAGVTATEPVPGSNEVLVTIPGGGGGTGNVTGPLISTNNAIPRFDGTDGDTIQDSGFTIDDDPQPLIRGYGASFQATISTLGGVLANSLRTDTTLTLKEAPDVAAGVSGFGRLRAQDVDGDTHLLFKDDQGVDHDLTGGNVSGPPSSTNLSIPTWVGATGDVLRDNGGFTYNSITTTLSVPIVNALTNLVSANVASTGVVQVGTYLLVPET